MDETLTEKSEVNLARGSQRGEVIRYHSSGREPELASEGKGG